MYEERKEILTEQVVRAMEKEKEGEVDAQIFYEMAGTNVRSERDEEDAEIFAVKETKKRD